MKRTMTEDELIAFVTHYGDDRFTQPGAVHYDAMPFDRRAAIPAFLETVHTCGWARQEHRQLAVVGAVTALIKLYPQREKEWAAEYPELFAFIVRHIRHTSKERPDWADFYLARWYITRDPEDVQYLLSRSEMPGEAGARARNVLDSIGAQNPAFREVVMLLRASSEVVQ